MPGQPQFRELHSAVGFLATMLEHRRFGELADACLQATDLDDAMLQGSLQSKRNYRLRAISALAEKHAAADLRNVYAGHEFPTSESQFKLGGHDAELGHVHIDFQRTSGRWVLREIWICR